MYGLFYIIYYMAYCLFLLNDSKIKLKLIIANIKIKIDKILYHKNIKLEKCIALCYEDHIIFLKIYTVKFYILQV